MGSPGRPSRAALKKWLEGNGVTQAEFAAAISVTQQHVSRILDGGEVSPDLARRIELAAGGAAAIASNEEPPVPWLGWFTRAEVRQQEQLEERARAFGLAAVG